MHRAVHASRPVRSTRQHTVGSLRRLAALAAAALAAAVTVPAASTTPAIAAPAAGGTAAPATVKAPYTVGVLDPGNDVSVETRRKNAYFGETVDVRKVSAGRDSDQVFIRVRIVDLLRPAKLHRRAPFLEQHIELSATVYISPTEGGLGALLGKVVASRDGISLQPRPDPDECAGTRLVADPKRDVVSITAPLTCLGPLGPYGGLTGRPINIDAFAYTHLRPGEAPAAATTARDGLMPGDLTVPDPAA